MHASSTKKKIVFQSFHVSIYFSYSKLLVQNSEIEKKKGGNVISFFVFFLLFFFFFLVMKSRTQFSRLGSNVVYIASLGQRDPFLFKIKSTYRENIPSLSCCACFQHVLSNYSPLCCQIHSIFIIHIVYTYAFSREVQRKV